MRDMYANRHKPECKKAFADFYWRTLLSVAFVIVLSSIAYGIFELSSVLQDAGSADAGSASTKPPALNRVLLQNTLDGFHSREARFESLKTGTPDVTDPSR